MQKGYQSKKSSAPAVAVKRGFAVSIGTAIPDLPPTLTLDTDDLPDLKGWKVGQTYELDVKVKLKSISQEDETGKKVMTGRFDVLDVEAEDPNETETDTENDDNGDHAA